MRSLIQIIYCIILTLESVSSLRITKRSPPSPRRFRDGIEQLTERDRNLISRKSLQQLNGRGVSLIISPSDIQFIPYARSNSNNKESVLMTPSSAISFRDNSKVVFYIHGFFTKTLDDGVRIRDALLEHTEDVDYVVLVDWRKLSLPFSWDIFTEYIQVAEINVPAVAQATKAFIMKHLQDQHYIYIIGFSLGGQIAGIAGRLVAASGKLKVDRITGLDPAGPYFEYSVLNVQVNKSTSLRPSDASFVDVIHTSELLGIRNPAGHLDTYVKENYCFSGIFGVLCRHPLAKEVFLSSLKSCSLMTCPEDITGSCSHTELSSCGYLADIYEGRGKHSLVLSPNPFSWNDRKCSEYLNVYLPAKDRICKDDQEVCRANQPYLSQCKERSCNSEGKKNICSLIDEKKVEWKCR